MSGSSVPVRSSPLPGRGIKLSAQLVRCATALKLRMGASAAASLASAATMFAVGMWSLYGIRALVGIAEACFLPGILLYLTYWFPRTCRARDNALFIM